MHELNNILTQISSHNFNGAIHELGYWVTLIQTGVTPFPFKVVVPMLYVCLKVNAVTPVCIIAV